MSERFVTRPDGRTFVSLRCIAPAAYLVVLDDARRTSPGRLFLNVDMADDALVTAARNLGFRSEIVVKAYEVPFAALIERFERRRLPIGYSIVPADRVATDQLFELDEQLRQDVPGTDGWVGHRDGFDDEHASTEFDPTGYLVARGPEGNLIGLIRFWRNDPIPRLGLVGVLPRHRTGVTASALLASGLHGASGWGSAVFSTETARPALQRRLERNGAVHIGTFTQMVLDHRLASTGSSHSSSHSADL